MRDEASKPDGVWDEFDWERFLQQQDRKTEQYLQLLEQYLDHPDRDRIIAREMGWSHILDENGQDWAANLEQLFSHDEAMEALAETGDEEDADEESLGAEPFEDFDEEGEEDEFEDFEGEESDDEEDDDMEAMDEEEDFETHPVYLSAMALTAWIDQTIQENELLAHEPIMVRMATHAAIAASKVAAALTDGEGEEIGMTIAYLKRGLHAMNTALDSLIKIQETNLLPADALDRVRTGIFETRHGIVDLMGQCRAEWRKRYGNC